MSFWRAIKMLLTLRCEESTHLMSESCHRDLTPVERWAVRLHQISCSYCRQVAEQLRLVDKAAQARAADRTRMPEAMRDRIRQSLLKSNDGDQQ